MTEKRLRVGIIGAGWVAGARHIPSFKKLAPSVEVRAILDRDPLRARALADKHDIAASFHESQDFYNEDLDVVSICTPPWTHADLAIEALRNGCHVFTEKPMAMSSREAAEMTRVAREEGRRLSVSHNFLFSRAMLRAEAIVARGDLGAVCQVIGLQLSNPDRRLPDWHADLPGGLFFDEAPHLLYLMRRFIGEPRIDFVSATAGEGPSAPLESVYAKLSGSIAPGVLTMSFDAPVSEWLLTVVGAKRVLVLDIFRDILVSLRPDGSHGSKEVLLNSLRTGADLAGGFLSSGLRHSNHSLLYGHEVLIEAFIESVRSGSNPPVRGEDGVAIVETMESILAAAAPTEAMGEARAS